MGARAWAARDCRAALILLLAATGLPAQPPGPAGMSPAAVSDSLSAIRDLERHLRTSPRDAAAWHRIGLIAWALSDRAQAPDPPRGLNAISLGRMADTSLRIAAELEPQNARYRLAVGKLLLYRSGAALTRFASYSQFERALEIARTGIDSITHAEAAVEFGRVYWRRYDTFANRRIATEPGGLVRSLADAMMPLAKAATEHLEPAGTGPVSARADAGATQRAPPAVAQGAPVARLAPMTAGAFQLQRDATLRTAIDAIQTRSQALPPDVAGQNDYARALTLFREAYDAAPSHARAFHSVAMALAAESKWSELETLSRDHVARFHHDGIAWLSLGLSLHRLGQTVGAGAAFDTALARLPADELRRIDRLDRILRRIEAAEFRERNESRRATFADVYWRMADPLWSRAGNDARTEFLARVTYAELRWTVPELGVRGADSDRGDAFIRYGPPGVMAQFGPTPESEGAAVTTVWIYDWGLMLVFAGAPSYATARVPFADRAWVEALSDAQPVRWESAVPVGLDSIDVVISRFRADHQLVSLLIAARSPTDSSGPARGTSVRTDIWLIDGLSQVLLRDSAASDRDATRTWSAEVARGLVLYRVETGGDGVPPVGRAAAMLQVGSDPATDIPPTGFALSDLVIARRAEPRTTSPARWRHLGIEPVVGSVAIDTPVSLVWEVYELASGAGSASYDVTLTVARERGIAGRLAARVGGALASIARISAGDDRIVVQFDRTVPHAEAVLDYLVLDLAGSPVGDYRLTLEVRDLSTGRTAARAARLAIR